MDDTYSEPTTSPRKRRENETPQQRLKREKAAERQRRKRERDRAATGIGPPPAMVFPAVSAPHPQDPHFHQQDYLSAPPQMAPVAVRPDDSHLTPEEIARRDRVRASARDRQRKHRQLVKQRKMRELGLDMGNEVMPPMDDASAAAGPPPIHYRVDADGNYAPVTVLAPHELQQALQLQSGPEPPFPAGPVHGGQTFATTLLLSFSCAPLLKQHLLRTLNMENDELPTLEPVIAEAWDRWDHARRGLVYHPPGSQEFAGAPSGPTYPYAEAAPAGPPPTQDFRSRFAGAMTVPVPFRAAFVAAQANGVGDQGASVNGTDAAGTNAGQAGTIDPHLGQGSEDKDDNAV